MKKLVTLGKILIVLLVASFAAADALAQIRRLIEQVDLKCYRIDGARPLNIPLRLDHLNPVFLEMEIPPEQVVVQEPQQLCVPVAKNEQFPPADLLQLIQFIDLKCYRITGESLDLPLQLDHLNPVLLEMGAPPEQVIVREPQQLCVPVIKNQQAPPPPIQFVIQFIDLKCYRIEGDPLKMSLQLDHLNPVFRRMQLPPEEVVAGEAQQLCVPVTKNQQRPPEEILQFLQFADAKCYQIEGDPLNIPLRLDHLNPVLQRMGAPPEQVTVQEPQKLCVPVAKNEQFPPD